MIVSGSGNTIRTPFSKGDVCHSMASYFFLSRGGEALPAKRVQGFMRFFFFHRFPFNFTSSTFLLLILHAIHTDQLSAHLLSVKIRSYEQSP